VRTILEENPPDYYDVTPAFREALWKVIEQRNLKIDGIRLIDYRGGQSVHSWELGLRGICTKSEIEFMDTFILERRRKKFGKNQDGKLLTFAEIASFWGNSKLEKLLDNLVSKGYIQVLEVKNPATNEIENRYKPVSGNFSFEVFKFLDLDGISITLVSSDAEKLGVHYRGRTRRITPREAARLQGFPDDFKLHKDDRKAYFQMGNAVSVYVARTAIAEALRVSGLTSTSKFIPKVSDRFFLEQNLQDVAVPAD
jgi:DNA (cytosine-5)-methyltransferase 1